MVARGQGRAADGGDGLCDGAADETAKVHGRSSCRYQTTGRELRYGNTEDGLVIGWGDLVR